MKIVVDASVAVKWLIGDQAGEQDGSRAIALLGAIQRGSVLANQPLHWVTEVAAVVARIAPDRAVPAIALLTHRKFTIIASRSVYRRAALLANSLNHHLFDTLYHAVALNEDATLVTADERYFAKAQGQGNIARLAEFAIG